MPSPDDLYDRLRAHPCVATDAFARTNLNVYRPRFLLMLRAVEEHLQGPRRAIIDVGCHNGFFLRLSEPAGFRRKIGVDFFELPRERSFLDGLEGAEHLRANFNDDGFLAPIADASIDCVSSMEVFEHLLNHPAGYLAECWRVLRPGGLLLFTTPNPATLANAVRLARGRPITWGDRTFARERKFADGKPAAFWDIHFREYVHGDVKELLLELPGCEIVAEGFVSNAPDEQDPLAKRLLNALVIASGLGGARLLAASQFFVLRRCRGQEGHL